MKPDGQSATSLAKTLYSLGGISKTAFENLTATLDCRNNLAHGFRARSPGISVERLGSEIRKILSERQAVADAG